MAHDRAAARIRRTTDPAPSRAHPLPDRCERTTMARPGRWTGLAAATLVVLGGAGYLAADAADLVPGFLTTAPVPTPAAPFPVAPGAVAPPPAAAVLSGPDTSAPVPDPDVVTDLVEALVADPRMGESTGVVVADLLTGAVLADRSGGPPRIPASVAKLYTAAAAMSVLGPETTIPTRVVQSQPGTIVLVGGGDMMLAADLGDPTAVNGRAGLADLAAQVSRALHLQGRTEVTLVIDTSIFSGEPLSPGWEPVTIANGFVAPVSPLAVDIAKRNNDSEYPPRYADPAAHTADLLTEALAAEGVTVTGRQRGTAAATAVELGRVESATVRELAAYVLTTSDNTISEVLGRLVAVEEGLPGSFAGATTAVIAAVGALGVDVSQVTLADASGLADGSALPARTTVELLLALTRPEHSVALPVLTDLAVAGWRGTLFDRLTTDPALGLVRAKTGSLGGVTSLAGTVLTAEGRLLAFAVIADRTPPGGQWGPRAAIDEFVQNLAGCGCQVP